jgi:DNA repair ATPase RecN
MINNIELKDFQGYENGKLDLHKSVNVVIGSSHSGKTTILKAIREVFSNYLRGKKFIRHGCNKSTITVDYSDSKNNYKIIRNKGLSENSYELITNGDIEHKQKYNNVSDSIPESIAQILNINDTNIQSQLSPFFLVFDTPGKVGKYFNSITNLSELDEFIKLINSKTTEYRNVHKHLIDEKSNLINITNGYKQLLDETNIEHNLEILNNYFACYQKHLQRLIAAKSTERDLCLYNKHLVIKQDVGKLLDKFKIIDTYSQLLNCVKDCKDFEVSLKSYISLQSKFDKVKIQKLYDNIKLSLDELNKIKIIINKIKQLNNDYDSLKNNEKKLKMSQVAIQNDYNKLVESIKICPFCGKQL